MANNKVTSISGNILGLSNFCDNPNCVVHDVLASDKTIKIKGHLGKEITLERFKYSRKDGKIISLCSCCHSAIQIITGNMEV